MIVGAAIGLLVVRGFMLDTFEEIGWRLFWHAFFKGDISTDDVKTVWESSTFFKSAIGMAVGAVLGLLLTVKFSKSR